MVLSSLRPESVFKYFEEISRIPRGSRNEKAVSDYICAFARENGLRAEQDAYHNLIIFKPGSPGYENHEPLILQAHLDMVCEKNAGTEHDFLRDPIKLKTDGDFVRAEGTTLGADNGMAVAYCMALCVMEDALHPPLEIILTSDEEAGMSGAENLRFDLLKGRRMINLDTSREGTFVVGSAGGLSVEYFLPVIWEKPPEDAFYCKIGIKGLKGGHSGGDINKERGNSIRLLGRTLRALENAVDFCIADLNGGMKVNAIPRESSALIVLAENDRKKADEAIQSFQKIIAAEYRLSDPGAVITCTPGLAGPDRVMAKDCGKNIISSLLLLPCGVLNMSLDIPGMVELSCNIGVLKTLKNKVQISCMPRGGADYRMDKVKEQFNALADIFGGSVKFLQRSPSWAYNPDSDLRKKVLELYKSMYGRPAIAAPVHSGLECGIFCGNIPGLDIISFGPDNFELHTPDEHISVSSVERVWHFLLALLKEL